MSPDTKSFMFSIDPGVRTRRELALLPFEQDVLTVSRCFFETYEKPDSQCWMQAFMEAEQRFQPPFGATIAHATHLTINFLQTARGGAFSYFPTSDAMAEYAVTPAEKQLIEVMRAVGAGDVEKAEWAALLLCHGGETERFLAAMERLCLIFGQIEGLRYQG
ncbi:MAG: hypothetical protein AAF665_16975 [Pseudomonadota bacterium]